MSTVIGAFETREQAEGAVHTLFAAGFPSERISILGQHPEGGSAGSDDRAALGLVTGATVGTAFGSVLPLLVGSAALAIPGVGTMLALGPLAAALTLALGGGLVGGLVGFLVAQGVSTEDAERYAEQVAAGAYLVAVECDPVDEERAAALLARAGAAAPTRVRSVPSWPSPPQ